MMDLHIYFGDSIESLILNREDKYLVFSQGVCEQLIAQSYDCVACNIMDNSKIEERDYMELSKQFFSSVAIEFEMLKNPVFYNLIIPIFNVIYTVRELLQQDVFSCIHLYGGNRVSFFTLNKAEGESGKQLLYKREWMMNPVLELCFAGSYPVTWHNKESKAKLILLFYIRELISYWSVVILYFLRIINVFRRSHSMPKKLPKKYLLALVTLKLQLNHLLDTFSDSDVPVVFLSPERISPHVQLIPPISLKMFFSVIFESHKLGKFADIEKLILSDNKISILVDRKFYKTIRIQYFRYLILLNQYICYNQKTAIFDHASAIINNKTWGVDSYADMEVASRLHKRLLTFQYVSMQQHQLPSYKVYDVVSFYNKDLYAFYKRYINDVRLYMPHYNVAVRKETDQCVISLFLQPEGYNDLSLEVSTALAKIVINCKGCFRLRIKPHYRQTNMKEIEAAVRSLEGYNGDKILFCDLSDSVGDILNDTDLTVGFSSSVLFESVFCRVPIVSIAPYLFVKEEVMNDYILKTVATFVTDMDQLDSIVGDYDQILERFKKSIASLHTEEMQSPLDVVKQFV